MIHLQTLVIHFTPLALLKRGAWISGKQEQTLWLEPQKHEPFWLLGAQKTIAEKKGTAGASSAYLWLIQYRTPEANLLPRIRPRVCDSFCMVQRSVFQLSGTAAILGIENMVSGNFLNKSMYIWNVITHSRPFHYYSHRSDFLFSWAPMHSTLQGAWSLVGFQPYSSNEQATFNSWCGCHCIVPWNLEDCEQVIWRTAERSEYVGLEGGRQ